MKFYLSSYEFGDEAQRLKSLLPENKRHMAYIPNGLDLKGYPAENRARRIKRECETLQSMGYDVEILDLKDYFGNENGLQEKLNSLNGVFVCGGNTFILRQAMKLSGFDSWIKANAKKDDFLYSGYSAGVCILAPSLKGLHIVDDPSDNPYNTDQVWDGLGLLDYLILPHFDSDHSESDGVSKEVDFCKNEGIKFRTLKDGEVIILE